MDDSPSAPSSSSNRGFKTTFASMSLHRTDLIRFLNFPESDIAAIRSVINQSWTRGLQSEDIYAHSYQFQCYGKPWSGQGSDAVPARVLIRGLLAHLFSQGWILTVSTDVSKAKYDKDTMIFRKQTPPPPASEWAAISFNEGDRLRLIGAPKKLLDDFQTLLKGLGLLQHSGWKEPDAIEFQLHGSPWRPSGVETMMTRVLLLRMLETLEEGGWRLYASVDQNTGPPSKYISSTDSWYCVRALDWTPGKTVSHR